MLDTFVRGLPRTFRNLQVEDGTSVLVQIIGEAGGEWMLVSEGLKWQLFAGRDPQATCIVQIDQDLAWRLFTRGINPEDARQQIQIDGDATLGEQVLKMVSIMV